jgi:hypothetical protein
LVFTFTYPLFYFFNSINKKKINKFKKIKWHFNLLTLNSFLN